MKSRRKMSYAELAQSNTVRGFTLAIVAAILKSHLVSVNVETAWVDMLLDVIDVGLSTAEGVGGVLGVVGLRDAIAKSGPRAPRTETIAEVMKSKGRGE